MTEVHHGWDTVPMDTGGPPRDNMAAVLSEIDRQIETPPSGDYVLGNMWRGLRRFLDWGSPLGQLIEQHVERQTIMTTASARVGLPVSEVVGKIGAAVRFDSVLGYSPARFPRDESQWVRRLAGIDADVARFSLVQVALDHLQVNTTDRRRYSWFEVLRQAEGDPEGRGMDWWEGGSSIQLGAKSTQLKRAFPYPAVTIGRFTGRTLPDGSPEVVPDDELARGGNALVSGPVIGGNVITSDIFRPNDKWIGKLALASVRPMEYLNPDFRREHRRIAYAKLPNVHFVFADITHPEYMEQVKAYCRGLRLKKALLSMVLNQVGQEKVNPTIRLAADLLDDDGTVYWFESGYVDPDDPSQFWLNPTWFNWGWGLFGLRKSEPDRIQTYFRFRTSRGDMATAGDGLVGSGDSALSIKEHLYQAARGRAA